MDTLDILHEEDVYEELDVAMAPPAPRPAEALPEAPGPLPGAAPKQSLVPRKAKGYDLRAQYRITLLVGLNLAVGIVLLFFRMEFRPDRTFEIPFDQGQEVVEMEQIEQTQQESAPPPPPAPPVPIEVPNDELLEDEALDIDMELDIDEAPAAIPPPPAPAIEKPKEVAEEDEEGEIFVVVEQMPEIIGGAGRLQQLVKYPEIARKAGLEGLVVVQIVINKDGTPSDPSIMRTGGDVLDEAAIEAVMQLRFKPGLQRGKPVRVKGAFPVRFRLRDSLL